MRRGTVVVHGDVGDFVASRMVAGTLALGGALRRACGLGNVPRQHCSRTEAPAPPPTFVGVQCDVQVIWQLLARDLEGFGAPFAGLARRDVRRFAGDIAVDGRGEWLVPAT